MALLETGRQADRRQRHPDADHIGEHVAGVGQQRQRVGRERCDQLDHEEHDNDREGGDQAASMTLTRPCEPEAVFVFVFVLVASVLVLRMVRLGVR